LALGIALAGLLRRPLSSRWRVADLKRVMYLDWESSRDEQRVRLWRLTEGLQSQPIDGAIVHRTMRRPLIDDITAIRAEVARNEVDLVIADSLAPACGPEPETAGAVVPALLALRSLATTVIIIAHVSKQSPRSKAPARPFGSIFVHNLARSTVEARRSETWSADERSYTLSLYHRKANESRSASPSGLELTFEVNGAVKIKGTCPDSGGAGLGFQIIEALRKGPQLTVTLAEMLDAKPDAIRQALKRLKDRDIVINLRLTKGGKSKDGQRALVDTRQDSNRDNAEEPVTVREPGDEDIPF